jgi:trehalose 6-phosphate phosphatase
MSSSDPERQARLEAVLAHAPAGLMLDIDGTISPIAPTPGAAVVPEPIKALLRRLAERLPLVAAVSGRAAADALRMVGVAEMVYVGNHGFEMYRHGRVEPLPEAARFQGTIAEVLRIARAELPLPGLLFEDKGLTASVHYRLAEDPETAGARAGAVLERLTAEHGLRLTPGRMVWEIRPPLQANKGTAVRWLVGAYGLDGAIFCGDDRTDVDAFRELGALRAERGLATLNVGVMAAETPSDVRMGADLLVDGVPGMERLLEQLVVLAGA